jgi:hypothetical protein
LTGVALIVEVVRGSVLGLSAVAVVTIAEVAVGLPNLAGQPSSSAVPEYHPFHFLSLWHCLTLPFSLLLQVDHGVIVVHFPKKIIITRYDSNRMLLLKVSQTSFFSPVFSKWPKF